MLKIHVDSTFVDKKIADIVKNSDAISLGIVTQLGSIVKKNSRSYAPVDTGALKGSIDMEIVGTDKAEIGTSLDYGWAQEYGSTKQKPQSFLRPALKDAQMMTRKIAEEVVKKYV